MASIGDRLEEARKRQGISIREAAEATKIRTDFLLQFENNQFDIDLPAVYRRGFLKNYASFLKMDVDKVMTDYNALLLAQGKSTGSRRVDRDSFGQFDIPESQPTLGSSEADPPGERARRTRGESGPADPVTSSTGEASLYWKLGIGAVVFIGVIVGLVLLLAPGSGSSNGDNNAASGTGGRASGGPVEWPPIIIEARADVDRVIVERARDRKEVFDGPLKAGDPPLEFDRGSVYSVGASNASAVLVRIGDQQWPLAESAVPGKRFYGIDGPVKWPPPQE